MPSRFFTAFVLVASAIWSSCGSSGGSLPEIRGSLQAVTSLEDGGIAVDYDAVNDGSDFVLAIIDPDRPDHDIASVALIEFGTDRRYVFDAESLGVDSARRSRLVVVLREGNGALIARSAVH